jgi:hypothetical protein
MRRCAWTGIVIVCAALAGLAARAGEKKGDAALIILDAQGKEVKLKGWRLTVGVRRMPTGAASGKGPEYVEFRDEHSTTYEAGILTLVPVGSLRKLDYDYDKKSVVAVVATAGGKDTTLLGTTRYKGINRLTIEGDADLGELGFASVKFQGGIAKGGITGVRFPAAEPVAAVPEYSAVIVGADKERTAHWCGELTALYHLADGSSRLLPQLMFKKTVKLDLAKIAALRHVEPEDKKQTSYDFEVTLTSGEKHTLTLLTKVDLEAGKAATLTGLVGRVAVGYQLFPAHTIAEVRMEQKKQ